MQITKESTARKVCIYTVCTGGYDNLKPPRMKMPGADYFLVTDDKSMTLQGYKQILIDSGDNTVKAQRKVKIWPYELMPGYDVYIYYDASYEIRGNLAALLVGFKGGFGVKAHSVRKCVYEEGKRVIELGKAAADAVNTQLDAYRKDGIPEKYGLQETGILIRDASHETQLLCQVWWIEVNSFTHRDQLGLPAAIFRTGIQPVYMRNHVLNAYFRQYSHKAKPAPVQPRIVYLQPFAPDLNIGKAYNDQCALAGENDWIVITDHDTMFLHPKTKVQIHDILMTNGSEYDLLGCMTNRIGSPHQCYDGRRCDNFDAIYHLDIAEKLQVGQYGQVDPIKQGVAGFFMAFRKKTWEKIRFAENTPHFDTIFSKEVIKSGGKIGLMKGVYLFHLYRPKATNPQYEYSHLKLEHE